MKMKLFVAGTITLCFSLISASAMKEALLTTLRDKKTSMTEILGAASPYLQIWG